MAKQSGKKARTTAFRVNETARQKALALRVTKFLNRYPDDGVPPMSKQAAYLYAMQYYADSNF